ncbi:hypothetical protein [Marinimicrobium agarilyticum]|uniref:hypothetical protein n=1 Tax=Marinimicrobium agarilyticum TaxID=306546 RepID=UPI00048262C5|nr:hypothetical protein [Marinimicrobium agarilyticum]
MIRKGAIGVLSGFLMSCALMQNGTLEPQPQVKGAPECPVVLQARPEPAFVPQGEAIALLEFRRVQCARPESERDSMVQSYLERSSRQAVMRTLMLATCAPDQTPGLLANSLVKARDMEPHSADIAALLDLLAAQAESYGLLERRLNATRKKLDDMIQGIRAIEAEMGEASVGEGAQP